MGLLAEMAGGVLSKLSGSQDPNNPNNLCSTILGLINHPEVGGLQGLVEKFKSAGLGHIAEGWVSQGPNPPVTADQLKQVFSSDQLRGFAQKLGIDPDEAANHLAQLLPSVVDHLTPDGTVPQGQLDASIALAALKAKLFGAG
jgi:uncharacterized protein YidB (DUF937 family)